MVARARSLSTAPSGSFGVEDGKGGGRCISAQLAERTLCLHAEGPRLSPWLESADRLGTRKQTRTRAHTLLPWHSAQQCPGTCTFTSPSWHTTGMHSWMWHSMCPS